MWVSSRSLSLSLSLSISRAPIGLEIDALLPPSCADHRGGGSEAEGAGGVKAAVVFLE